MTTSGNAAGKACLFVTIVLGLAGVAFAQRGGALPPPQDGHATIAPPWRNAPETVFDNTVPHGTMHRFTMKSEDSKIYKGIARERPGEVVPYERPVALYVPAQYVPGTPAPFIVVVANVQIAAEAPWAALPVPIDNHGLIVREKS